ncbi:MAG TPA: 3-phosphoshikimate 1-carboxyvinyltransferase [Acidimicrobiales bacterium]|nr:3-phosphoshikimate 1-carboxyvinyltransferase [Acidimicrobiales bacterium]
MSTATHEVLPLAAPVEAVVRPPGSKSLTNRALVCAGLAQGRSVIDGALFADDTEAMAGALGALGAIIIGDPGAGRIEVIGTGGELTPGPVDLDVRLSGTTSRFLLPVVALGHGRYRVDGGAPLRARPMGPVLDGIRTMGAAVEHEGEDGHLPVTVVAPGGLSGGTVRVRGDISSQFLSGLLLAAPYADDGVRLELTTPLVARDFVAMTAAVMNGFDVHPDLTDLSDDGGTVVVPAGRRYFPADYRVEPDASAASYFLSAAAICGGQVTIDGLGSDSLQGDTRFADVLGAMGARVEWEPRRTTIVREGPLRGLGDVDLSRLPDMAQTLAVVAVFADAPTRVRGVGFIRGHETDRIAAVVRELRRCGIEADEADDGFLVRPGTPRPAVVETYADHRMAMSFALLGLRVPGITIADPGCVAKTFPGYWDALDTLRSPGLGITAN